MSVKTDVFGQKDGKEIKRFTISSRGMEVRIIELGASLQGIRTLGRDGEWVETVLHYESVEEYLKGTAFFGTVCGRNANRITNAKVTLNGKEYALEKNIGEHSLHSGSEGFHFCVFSGEQTGEDEITFQYLSPAMEQGFPGNMLIKVIYRLVDQADTDSGSAEKTLEIRYVTLVDEDTICNVTNHAYFNLEGEGTILDHELCVSADFYTPMNELLLPTGEIATVENTPFDVRTPTKIGDRFGDAPGKLPGGYDHNFVLNKKNAEDVVLYSPKTGIGVKTKTDLPGVQIYAGYSLTGTDISHGKTVPQFGGICMETQYFPDAPTNCHFPSSVQKAGTMKVSQTSFTYFLR